jgi:O-antigen ligase
MGNIKRTDIIAYLWPIYFWKVIFLKPLFYIFSDIPSVYIAGGFLAFILLGVFLFLYQQRRLIYVNNGHLFLIIIIFLFILNFLFNMNENMFNYFYNFILLVLPTLLILAYVKDYGLLIRNFYLLSIIAILIYGPWHFFNNDLFANYMDFGFSIALPAMIGIFLYRKNSQLKWVFVIEIFAMFMLVVFANRSALLAIILMYLSYPLLFKKQNTKIFFKYLISAAIITLIILVNYKILFTFLLEFINLFDISSYSLQKYSNLIFEVDDARVLSGRDIIWQNAINEINTNPFGYGVGGFEEKYDGYSHNFVLDMILYWGFFGFCLFFILLTFSMKKFISLKKSPEKLLIFIFFISSFPKLFFSSVFLNDISFFSFFMVIFILSKFRLKKEFGK